jgi:hypothetical protein
MYRTHGYPVDPKLRTAYRSPRRVGALRRLALRLRPHRGTAILRA